MADNTTLVAVIGVIGGGGFFGGVVALIKVRPEAGAIVVKSATDLVVIQQGALSEMQTRLSAVEAERDGYREERDAMRRRVTELEASVATLQRQVGGEAGA